MIVVVGRPGARAVASLAGAIAARGGRVEVVGTVSADRTGDRLLLDLGRAGVGHAAVLRTAALELEPADLDLALQFLPDGRVVVLIGEPSLARTASNAASWSGAVLVVVTATGEALPELAASDRQLVVAAPARDPDGAFAGLLAELALRLDGGEPLGTAWSSTLASLAVEASVSGDPGGPGSERRTAPAGARRPARRSPPRASDRRSGRR